MLSIRLKIILIIIFCTFIFGGIIAYFSVSKSLGLLEKQASSLMLADTNSLANKIESENNKIESIISTVASLMANNFLLETAKTDKNYLEERTAYLSNINAELLKKSHESGVGAMSIYATFNVETFEEVYETWHTIQNDAVVLMEDEPLELFDNPDNPDMAWYFNPIKEKRGLWTATYEDALTKIPMYSYVEPAISKEAKIIGVVGMDISLEGISNFVSKQETIKNGFSFLLDSDNDFIVEPRETISQPLLGSLLRAKDAGTEGIVSDEQAIIAFNLLPNKQLVATYAKRSDIFDDVFSLRTKLVFFTIAMTIISAILGFALIAPISQRINKLKDATKADGDEKAIMELSYTYFKDELGELSESFYNMLQRIKKSRLELENNNHSLENRVRERTMELENKMKELEKFNQLSVNRELKMIELKKQLTNLTKGQGDETSNEQ
jgi:methyl-accepting chemotaxis protein